MRRSARLAPALLALAFALPLAAGTPPGHAAKPAASHSPVPLLWKVSDKDNSLYLLGSFHMLRENDYPLSKDIDAAYADAEEVVFELPPEEMLSDTLGAQMAMAALRTDGTALDDDLPPALARKLADWATRNADGLRAVNMGPEMLQMLEPWFASLIVTIVDARGAGFDSERGLDAHFGKRAKADNKRTQGLETGADQLAMLDGMTRAEQVQLLEESMDPKDGGPAALDALHGQWRTGDADALWKKMGVEFRGEYPALYKRINSDRNAAWTPELARRLDAPGTDDTLVVVGALHLLGEDGVVARLKAKGYKVERICSACTPR